MNAITFMRHGLVENPAGVIYGAWPDFHLSAAGQAEVRARAKELAAFPYTTLVASPLTRAQETANIVRRTALPQLAVTTDDRLTEWVYVSQGLTREQWAEKYAALKAIYHEDPHFLPAVVDGVTYETFNTMDTRLQSFIDSYRDKGLVLAVSHGDPILSALTVALRQSYPTIKEQYYLQTAQARTLNFTAAGVVLSEYPQ